MENLFKIKGSKRDFWFQFLVSSLSFNVSNGSSIQYVVDNLDQKSTSSIKFKCGLTMVTNPKGIQFVNGFTLNICLLMCDSIRF